MRIRSVALLVVVGLASAAAQAQIVNFLGDLDTEIASLAREPGRPCYFGNLRTPGALEPFGDLYQQSNNFSFAAAHDNDACGCVGGWMVAEVHLLLANPSDGPIDVYLGVFVDGQGEGTVPSGCLEPHGGWWGELTSSNLDFSLPLPGYYELVIPVVSPCAFFGCEYFLKCEWGVNEIPEALLVVDADGARPCEVLWGKQMAERWWWVDVFQSGFWRPNSGAPIWWVEATCCEPPIGVETRSWGGCKSLYR